LLTILASVKLYEEAASGTDFVFFNDGIINDFSGLVTSVS
jgi:hypothetical protein